MPSSQQDYYAALGVLRESSFEEIKRAYYAAARRFHPDQNMLPGETELFLEIQRAYEVLSNRERRASYDATLPEEEARQPAPVVCKVQYSRERLVHLDEPQLIYALLEATPLAVGDGAAMTPLNLCLVLDRSTSMHGDKLEVAKAAAIRILRMLRPDDVLGLVSFSDHAEVLLPCRLHQDLNRAQSLIQSIQTGGATEIFRGLEAGLAELRKSIDPKRGSHLIILTDGHTYGDQGACLQLADEAALLNIGISGFGLGGGWNDIFLDSLVSRTGGNSTYIAQPHDIESVLVEKFKALARILVEDAVLEFKQTEGIQVQDCFRLQPAAGPIKIGEALHLGPILHDMPLSVLFEFVIAPSASQTEVVILLEGTLKMAAVARPASFPVIPLLMACTAATTSSSAVPPPSMLNALSKLALYRLQERSRQEAQAGEYEAATRHLRALALRLHAHGHHGLAKTALLEAENVERLQHFSEEGSKEIKYGTRALMQPALGQPQ